MIPWNQQCREKVILTPRLFHKQQQKRLEPKINWQCDISRVCEGGRHKVGVTHEGGGRGQKMGVTHEMGGGQKVGVTQEEGGGGD